MKLLFLIIFPLGMISSCATTKNKAYSKPIVIQNVSVVDVVTGSVIADQTLVIEKNIIKDMGNAGETRVPTNAKVVEGKGKFVIPGLWDMHVHLELTGEKSLPFFIANGVTGVRDMGANSFSLLHAWKQQIEKGTLTGPHIITGGPMLDGPFVTNQLRVTVKTDAEARRAVDSLAALGVDFIKVHQQISKPAYLALADQASKNHMPFVGHLPAAITMQEAMKAGQKSIEHVSSVPDTSALAYSLISNSETRITPTLLFYQKIAKYRELSAMNDPRFSTISSSLKAFWKEQVSAWGQSVDQTIELMKKLLPVVLKRTQLLNKAGVQLLAGTDLAIVHIYPGSSLHEELELFVTAGLSPIEALRTATINPAKFFNKENTLGTVQVGKNADLILLNSNPLQSISNTKDIAMVVFNGILYDTEKIKYLQRGN